LNENGKVDVKFNYTSELVDRNGIKFGNETIPGKKFSGLLDFESMVSETGFFLNPIKHYVVFDENSTRRFHVVRGIVGNSRQ
jgi:hypothetical protein